MIWISTTWYVFRYQLIDMKLIKWKHILVVSFAHKPLNRWEANNISPSPLIFKQGNWWDHHKIEGLGSQWRYHFARCATRVWIEREHIMEVSFHAGWQKYEIYKIKLVIIYYHQFVNGTKVTFWVWHTGCSGKIVFLHNSLQPIPRLHRWLVIFCITNGSRVLAGQRWQTFENSWKKNNI